MLRTVFLKTLYEKRWMLFWWSLVTFLLILAIVALFPLFKDSFANLSDVPESLQSLVGNTADYTTITGWLSFQVFDQMVFIGIIMGIIVGGSLLSGEENDGTLQSLLTLPVKRASVYWQKFAALALMLGVVTLCLLAGSALGVVLVGESVSVLPLLTSSVMAILLGLLFAALTYAVGAIIGRRGVAGTLIGLFAFASFMISSLAAGISALKYPDYLSPFHYYNKPSPFDAGFQTDDATVLVIITIAALLVGFSVFIKRDIYGVKR